jgi:hypothetical protein
VSWSCTSSFASETCSVMHISYYHHQPFEGACMPTIHRPTVQDGRSSANRPNWALTPFKSASKIRISSFVNPSQIAMLPKRRVWKEEPTFPNEFSKHFSTIRSPKSSTHALEKVLRNLRFIFCSFFQNLRLGGVIFVKDGYK